MTIDAAYASFTENTLGSLERGKLADIVTFAFGKAETAANDQFKTFAHDVAMQIAAAAPVAARRDDVPADIIEHDL